MDGRITSLKVVSKNSEDFIYCLLLGNPWEKSRSIKSYSFRKRKEMHNKLLGM